MLPIERTGRVGSMLAACLLAAGLTSAASTTPATAATASPGISGQQRIYFDRGFTDTWYVRPDGTGATSVLSGYFAGPVSPDGTTMLVHKDGPDRVFRTSPDGLPPRYLVAGREPVWSPGGSQIAYRNGSAVWVMNADGSGRHAVIGNAEQPAWSSDGSLLFFLRRGADGLADVWRVRADGTAGRMIVSLGGDDSHFLGSAAPRNGVIFQRCSGTCLTTAPVADLWRATEDGSGLVRLTHDSAYESFASYSPDGTRIAFSRSSSRLFFGGYHVFTMAASGAGVRQITAGTSFDRGAWWAVVPPAPTLRVSVSTGGAQADLGSVFGGAISTGGRYVVFASDATNLVPADTNGVSDVFRRDLVTGTTMRVSTKRSGAQADAESGAYGFSVSADGRFVGFESRAGNLAPSIAASWNAYVKDTQSGAVQLVSTSSTGVPGDGGSFHPALSASSRFVAFESYAANLVFGDTNGEDDIFVRDRLAGTTERVSLSSAGVQGNAQSGRYGDLGISANGRFVVFGSAADNLVPGDTNGVDDIFLRDLVSGTTERVSIAPGGVQADNGSYAPAVSADGRYVVFTSVSGNLVPGDTNGSADVFVRDRLAGTTSRVSLSAGRAQAAGPSGTAYQTQSVTGDGRFVVFQSDAANLVPGDTNGKRDVFVRDRATGSTTRVNLGGINLQSAGPASYPALSSDGRYATFSSFAPDLVGGDTNRRSDVYRRQLR